MDKEVKHRRRGAQYPPGFDEEAKWKSMTTMKQHEFTKQNIKEIEQTPNLRNNIFDYDSTDKSRYTGMSFNHLFFFPTSFKAIQWGAFIGSLFGFHRYYWTRSFQNATKWFVTITAVVTFQVFFSWGFNDLISDMGMRNSQMEEQYW